MAFSFNPGQIAPPGGQAPGPAGSSPSAAPGTMATSSQAVQGDPKSPFYFIRDRGQPVSIIMCVQIVLVVLAILSIFTAILLYSYSLYLTASIKDKQDDLAKKEENFKDYPIADMKKVSNRFSTLNTLLKEYVSPISPLKFLEDVVEDSVYFDEFIFSRSVVGQGYTITFVVNSGDYRGLIQQLASLKLPEYSKVVADQKNGLLIDLNTGIKINVSAQAIVQGKLPDEITFYNATVTPVLSGTSTPSKSISP